MLGLTRRELSQAQLEDLKRGYEAGKKRGELCRMLQVGINTLHAARKMLGLRRRLPNHQGTAEDAWKNEYSQSFRCLQTEDKLPVFTEWTQPAQPEEGSGQGDMASSSRATAKAKAKAKVQAKVKAKAKAKSSA